MLDVDRKKRFEKGKTPSADHAGLLKVNNASFAPDPWFALQTKGSGRPRHWTTDAVL